MHIAIIMDGNGRWAKARGLERSAGHVEGVDAVHRITEQASDIGVKYLTLYTFSTENWNRPQAEVDALMHLIVLAIERETPEMIRKNVRMVRIGDDSRMPATALERLDACMAQTAHCTGLTLCLAISYSSRWEITRAARSLAEDAAAGRIRPVEIDDAAFAARLSTAGMPDPDLLIRTGGDRRVSNYLLWQIAYSEIIINEKYWPDYQKADLLADIIRYQGRERRFGLISEQLK